MAMDRPHPTKARKYHHKTSPNMEHTGQVEKGFFKMLLWKVNDTSVRLLNSREKSDGDKGTDQYEMKTRGNLFTLNSVIVIHKAMFGDAL